MKRLFLCLLLLVAAALPLVAEPLSDAVARHATAIEKPSRQTIGPVIAELAASGDPMAARFLQAWEGKTPGQRESDRAFFLLAPDAAGYALTDLTGAAA